LICGETLFLDTTLLAIDSSVPPALRKSTITPSRCKLILQEPGTRHSALVIHNRREKVSSQKFELTLLPKPRDASIASPLLERRIDRQKWVSARVFDPIIGCSELVNHSPSVTLWSSR